MRVPDFPHKANGPVVRLSPFRDGGYVLISHCSSGANHDRALNYEAMISVHGDVEEDFAFKSKMTCP